jgi:hypothetical protein
MHACSLLLVKKYLVLDQPHTHECFFAIRAWSFAWTEAAHEQQAQYTVAAVVWCAALACIVFLTTPAPGTRNLWPFATRTELLDSS